MDRKQADREARRMYGSAGSTQVVLGGIQPFQVGVLGEFALDVRGTGNSWGEALRAAALDEAVRLDQWRVARASRLERARLRSAGQRRGAAAFAAR